MTGMIHGGDMDGFYVRILDDTDQTGGYYLLYSRDFSDRTAEGYDEWYENESTLQSALKTLKIDWL